MPINIEFGCAATWLYFPRDSRVECDLTVYSGGGEARMWVNDTELPRQPTSYADRFIPVPKQTIAFRKGWN